MEWKGMEWNGKEKKEEAHGFVPSLFPLFFLSFFLLLSFFHPPMSPLLIIFVEQLPDDAHLQWDLDLSAGMDMHPFDFASVSDGSDTMDVLVPVSSPVLSELTPVAPSPPSTPARSPALPEDYLDPDRRPDISYAKLAAMAIDSMPEKRATVGDIYAYITARFPYYKKEGSNQWWKV